MEQWRFDQLETIAHRMATNIVRKDIPEDIDEDEFYEDEIGSAVNSRKINHAIEVAEVEAFTGLLKEKIDELLNIELGLEENTFRLDVPMSPERKGEKKGVSKYSRFETEKNPPLEKVYERASKMANFTAKKEISLSQEQFEQKIEELLTQLQEKYPFLFDSTTGEPLTAIQPGYVYSYPLTPKEESGQRGGKDAAARYRTELLKLEEYMSKLIHRELEISMPHGLSNPLRLKCSEASELMQQEGVVLYLPELYHGVSPRLAQEHYQEFLEKDFRLCEPLQGMMIAAQNMETLDRDYRLSQRIQAYHLVQNKEGRYIQVFGLVLTANDVGFLRVPYEKASAELSSGLIFDPQ